MGSVETHPQRIRIHATMWKLGVQFIAIAPLFPIDRKQRIAYNYLNETQTRN